MFNIGANANQTTYFHQDFAAINMAKPCSYAAPGAGWANQAEFDAYIAARSAAAKADDWFPALPAGKQIGFYLKKTEYLYDVAATPTHNFKPATPFRAGTYIVTWTGGAKWRFAFLKSGVTQTIVNANRVDLNFPTAESSTSLYAVVESDSATLPCDADNLKIIHTDDVALDAAGGLIHPLMLAKWRGASVLRALDLTVPMDVAVRDGDAGIIYPLDTQIGVANLPTINARQYVFWPAAAIGKYATEVSVDNGYTVDLWLPVSVRHTYAALTETFTRIAANYPNGKVWAEAGNEYYWNTAYPFNEQAKYMLNIYFIGADVDGGNNYRQVYKQNGTAYPLPYSRTGTQLNYVFRDATNAIIDHSDIIGSMHAHYSVKVWLAAEAVFGRNRVVRVLAGQDANINARETQFRYTTTELGTSGTLAIKIDVYATGPYVQIYDAASAFPDKVRQCDDACKDKDYLTPANLITGLNGYLNTKLIPNAQAAQAMLTSLGSTAKMVCYEGAGFSHTNAYMLTDPTFGSASTFTVATATNSLTYTPNDPLVSFNWGLSRHTRDQLFENGEIVSIYRQSTVPFSTTPDYTKLEARTLNQYPSTYFMQRQVYCRRFSTNGITLHPTLADANNNTNIITLTGDGNNCLIFNATRLKALNDMLEAFYSGTAYRDFIIKVKNLLLEPYYTQGNVFTLSGRFSAPLGNPFGMGKSIFDADDPVGLEFREMNKHLKGEPTDLLS